MSDPENKGEAWLERIREGYRSTPPLGPDARRRLDDALAAEPRPGSLGSIVRWWLEPRGFAARPWAVAAAIVALLGVGVLVGRISSQHPAADDGRATMARSGSASADSMTVVHFTLSAPGAASIALVGDFNDWDASATPMRQTAAGVWSVSIPLSHGRHVYAFVVNSARWVNDPGAPLAPEDGFGVPNSVVVVGWPRGT